MHLGRFLPGLAASSEPTPMIRHDKPQCLKDCVRTAIEPFVATGAQEGFRQALSALNAMETCMASQACMETVETFVEEITHMVFKDRLDDGNGHFAKSEADGYTGSSCDENCLVRTAQIAAGEAGSVAMAVGQKHFYGNDALWNRWSPQQMLELDRAIRQLKGRNLAEKAYIFEADEGKNTTGHMEREKTASIRKFDLAGFRYNGTAEFSLLHHPKITREMARKVLSHIPGWGADPDDMSHDAEPGSLDVQVPSKEYFLARDAGSFEGFDKFDKDVRDMIQLAITIIGHKPESSGLKGFAHFLYHQRLYPESTVENLTEVALEPWKRVIGGIEIPIRLSRPHSELLEEQIQLGAWAWQHHAYAIANTSRPIKGAVREEDAENKGVFGYLDNQNKNHGARLVQWVADNKAEPLKGVEGGYTHQPWTNPWFFEYPSSSLSWNNGLRAGMPYTNETVYFQGKLAEDAAQAIRGYTFEMRLYKKAFKTKDDDYVSINPYRKTVGEPLAFDYFRDHAFDKKTGAVADHDIMLPYEFLDPEHWGAKEYEDLWPYVTVVTGDGRAFRRRLGDAHFVTAQKTSYDVLTAKGKPIFDERGEPIRIVYDNSTGLAETRYGRALVALDKFMSGM